jgi:hypothetical protein
VSPVTRVVGRVTAPLTNGLAADTPVTVTGLRAVTVTDLVEVRPTATEPKSVGDPWRDTVVGRPNP